jgi:hypothetical protein
MSLIRYIILGVLIYLVFRFFKKAWTREKPRVHKGRSRDKKRPFEDADIQDVSYTELSEGDDNNNRSQ